MVMPQQNDCLPLNSYALVSSMDYSEARTILNLTTLKQKQFRRQHPQTLLPQLLLKRTYVHVCQLLDSDCSIGKSLPLATVDTNKRKLDDDHQVPTTINKKSKGPMDNDLLHFLHELHAVKVLPSDQNRFIEPMLSIVFVVSLVVLNKTP